MKLRVAPSSHGRHLWRMQPVTMRISSFRGLRRWFVRILLGLAVLAMALWGYFFLTRPRPR